MKRLICAAAVVGILAGCATEHGFVLAPGEMIVANSHARADALRAVIGQDLQHTGRVVTVSAPVIVSKPNQSK